MKINIYQNAETFFFFWYLNECVYKFKCTLKTYKTSFIIQNKIKFYYFRSFWEMPRNIDLLFTIH